MILTSISNHLQKEETTNVNKASAIKSRENTKAPEQKPPRHESTSEKQPSHQSTSEKTVKPPQKKPPSHESTTEKPLEHSLPTQCNHES
jgi:hypothetical protein